MSARVFETEGTVMPGRRERKKRERGRRRSATPPSGGESSRLAAEQLLQASADQARQTAEPYLRADDLPARVTALAAAELGLALRLMRQSPHEGQHECRPGCDFCCHTAVTVAAPEVFAIAAYLKEHYSHQELQGLRAPMDRNAELAAGMTRDEYIAKLISCALRTEDGNCRSHPVRPLACAGFLSTSRAKCEAEFHRVFGRDRVPVDRYAMVVGLGVSNGLLSACQEAGLDGNFYELHHALRRALDTPDAIQRWARGADVFAGCLR